MAPNRFYPFETHGMRLKLGNRVVPKYIPFIPYLPVRFGECIFTYIARNYFPWDLKKLFQNQRFNITKHTYISQTFEEIGGHRNTIYKKLRPLLRRIFFVLERIPLLRGVIGVSQVVVAQKDH